LRFPTKKEFIQLTITTFVLVIVSGVFFIAVDLLFA